MKEILTKRNILVFAIIIAAAMTRFIDLGANFSPILAIALFSGAYVANKKLAFIIPMAAMFVSDIFLGLHEIMPFVYGSFAAAVFIGQRFLQKPNFKNVLLSAIAGSVLFFVVTNFAVWVSWGVHSWEGFVANYVNALPFFRNSLAGNLVFSTVLFGGFALSEKFAPKLSTEN